MRYLFVVAHPDDECDYCGATIRKLINNGCEVAVAITSCEAQARRVLSNTLYDDLEEARSILGYNKLYMATYPNLNMNTIAFSKLMQFIISCIIEWDADAVITHHPSDINNDHYITSCATQMSFQKLKERNSIVNEFYFLESSSATEWSLNSRVNKFIPNTYVEISTEYIETKYRALEAYKNVSRPYPHPQCIETFFGLAALRGSQSGYKYAEAFECIYRCII